MLAQAIIKLTVALAIAVLFAWGGYKITRLPSRAWLICFWAAFAAVLPVILLHRIPLLAYQPGFAWLANGLNEFYVLTVCIPFIFAILVPRLPVKRQRYVIGLLAVLLTIYFTVPPFLDPALLYLKMEGTDTWIEHDVCLQTTNYTCGPASAVTALRQFGIHATEAEMAIASSCSRTWGTSEYKLAKAIRKKYGSQGIICKTKPFNEVQDLKGHCPVIVIVKFQPLVDHFITVLSVEDDHVIVGDPLKGRENLTYSQFQEKWRKIGIIVSKQDSSNEL